MPIKIGFRNRNASDLLNKNLAKILCENIEFDVELVSSEGKSVLAHRLVLSMYSLYFETIFSQSLSDSKIIVPLMMHSHTALEKIIELLYYGEINVLPKHKSKVIKAIEHLEISSVKLPTPPVPPFRLAHGPANHLIVNVNVVGSNGAITKLPERQQKAGPVQQHKQQSDHLRQQTFAPLSTKDVSAEKANVCSAIRNEHLIVGTTDKIEQNNTVHQKNASSSESQHLSIEHMVTPSERNFIKSAPSSINKIQLGPEISTNLLYGDVNNNNNVDAIKNFYDDIDAELDNTAIDGDVVMKEMHC